MNVYGVLAAFEKAISSAGHLSSAALFHVPCRHVTLTYEKHNYPCVKGLCLGVIPEPLTLVAVFFAYFFRFFLIFFRAASVPSKQASRQASKQAKK